MAAHADDEKRSGVRGIIGSESCCSHACSGVIRDWGTVDSVVADRPGTSLLSSECSHVDKLKTEQSEVAASAHQAQSSKYSEFKRWNRRCPSRLGQLRPITRRTTCLTLLPHSVTLLVFSGYRGRKYLFSAGKSGANIP